METDDEQVENLKTWLKENGISIVLGIVIGVGGLGGYRYWVHQQKISAEQASAHFTKMISALSADNSDEVQTYARLLIDEHASTEYALMAQMALAKDHVGKGEFDQAEEFLQQVVGSAAQQPLAYLARTRLAALQMHNDKFDTALSTLAINFPAEFDASVDELRGDIYARQGKLSDAIDAYRKAQLAQPPPTNAEFLQQKLDDLGGRG